MIIQLITFASHLQGQNSLRASHEVILAEIEKYFTIHVIDYRQIDQLSPDRFAVLFLATGGVERLVIQHFEQLPHPTILLADGMQNSLASALEVAAWLRARGMKNEILHGDLQEIIRRLFVLYNNFVTQRRMRGMRIGVIGTPSHWLVASNVDYLLAQRRWGIRYVDLPLEQLYQYYEEVSEESVDDACAHLTEKALACREATPEDLVKSMRLYHALKRMVNEEHLSALTLSCFRLLEQTRNTGCLALALLNDEGIVAGCEGDLQSVFTMLTVRALTGKPSFMANPSQVNTRTNELVLAHCTVGLAMTERFILRNHFETESGIGIQGILPTGDVTVVKCGNECLDDYYLATGTLTENTNYVNLCRTQVRIRLNSPVDYFLKRALGNHHIVVPGNQENILNDFLQANGCKRVE